MKVTVKYYARFRDFTGKSEESIEGNFINLDGLLENIKKIYPKFGNEEFRLVAINGKYANDKSATLRDGDVISLFPPVSGG